MGEPVLHAHRERVSHFVGAGCLIQALGIAAPFLLGHFLGVVGTVIGVAILLVLFVVGSGMATSWRCGHCKNPLANKAVKICPICKADLS